MLNALILRALASGLLTIVAAVAAQPASAARVETSEYQSAAGGCQGALPAFAQTLRARPLAIRNEGAATAFVTCAGTGTGNQPSTGKLIRQYAVLVGNGSTNGQAMTVSCTFVEGRGFANDAQYFVRTITLSAGTAVQLNLNASDISGDGVLRYPQVSCGLPPNGLLYGTEEVFNYDVGA